MDAKYRSREIRWLLLQILHEARKSGTAQKSGWLNQLMAQELLSVQGYDLPVEEMKDHLEYLLDKGCVEKVKVGDRPPQISKYRILARGIDAL